MQADRFRLRQSLRWIEQAAREGKSLDRKVEELQRRLDKSCDLRKRREETRPNCNFDLDLPILARREEIADAIRDNQVVVICGETGSGKSTQLPKIYTLSLHDALPIFDSSTGRIEDRKSVV